MRVCGGRRRGVPLPADLRWPDCDFATGGAFAYLSRLDAPSAANLRSSVALVRRHRCCDYDLHSPRATGIAIHRGCRAPSRHAAAAAVRLRLQLTHRPTTRSANFGKCEANLLAVDSPSRISSEIGSAAPLRVGGISRNPERVAAAAWASGYATPRGRMDLPAMPARYK